MYVDNFKSKWCNKNMPIIEKFWRMNERAADTLIPFKHCDKYFSWAFNFYKTDFRTPLSRSEAKFSIQTILNLAQKSTEFFQTYQTLILWFNLLNHNVHHNPVDCNRHSYSLIEILKVVRLTGCVFSTPPRPTAPLSTQIFSISYGSVLSIRLCF